MGDCCSGSAWKKFVFNIALEAVGILGSDKKAFRHETKIDETLSSYRKCRFLPEVGL